MNMLSCTLVTVMLFSLMSRATSNENSQHNPTSQKEKEILNFVTE